MFDRLSGGDSRPLAFMKRAALVCLAAFLLVGAVSAHRAYYQVRGLELRAEPQLRAGAAVLAAVVTSGRTDVDVRVELVQGQRAETLLARRVPGNEFAFFDPRTRREELTAAPSAETLSRFEAGPARLRATALGRSQWMRVPPPVVRELEVTIVRE